MTRPSMAKAFGSALLLVLATMAVAVAADAGPVPVRSFFSDRRAYLPGDVLTVLVLESASATSEASTRAKKDESVSVDFLKEINDPNQWGAGWDRSYGGAGQVERSGKLLARITVRVMETDPAGQMVVHGEQEIRVNNETQRIRLDGLVRRDDVAADNTVPSWRVNDARIEFTGRGVLGRTQEPGPFARIFGFFGRIFGLLGLDGS